jgi:hypothetical protein
LTEDERAGIEHEYFERADVLDRVCAAEDDLIDDYLSNRLASGEHGRFERYYLATPCHRTRVAVVRALRTTSSTSGIVISSECEANGKRTCPEEAPQIERSQRRENRAGDLGSAGLGN